MPSNHESAQINFQSMTRPSEPFVVLHEPKNSSNTLIGSMYSTDSHDSYSFKCYDTECKNATFGRWYDFKRHYNGAHAAAPIVFWCEIEGCPRSKAAGDRPFPRKDKVKDHFESVHGGEMEMSE
jgi:hypothetical protein